MQNTNYKDFFVRELLQINKHTYNIPCFEKGNSRTQTVNHSRR